MLAAARWVYSTALCLCRDRCMRAQRAWSIRSAHQAAPLSGCDAPAFRKDKTSMPMRTRAIAVLALCAALVACRTPSADREAAGAAAASTTGGASDPRAESLSNVRLVGYHDLQGRESLVVTTLSDAANGSWAYVGHHESYWDGKPKLNPITGRMEWNGTSLLDV